ncbi:hypothetical protein DEU56DRAFT_743289 [Suillus clintonianus]|uniref:uncharacterized protein n=1 Tax=Suillus clintonianus TaxID=1904413 RepID=UPI001B8728BA|nr:uncharacterized protein DEU56DRAFT_743289 [Suillus clintonianus]KAG2125974.1 hypothetical protein DEU56DRAFT_743289 [Suillus clintonianus]
MSTDVLSHFGVLDELIQVIYQGLDRFVALSQVTESAWSIYLGLKGPEGRWWRGSWSATHILNITGVQSGPQVLENFAEKLRTTFVNGDLTIGEWTEGESDINLTFGLTAKHPLHMALKSLSAAEAASHATAVFTEIALQAQSRKCQLNPPFPSRNVITVIPESSHANSGPLRSFFQDPVPAAVNPVAERKIKTLEAELARSKERSPPGDTTSKPSASSRPPKGASLANPNKKARKYQALEFESDED